MIGFAAGAFALGWALGVLWVGARELWLGVLGVYCWLWWLDDPARDPLRRAAWEKTPTLVVWGHDDPVVPRRAMRVFERELADAATYLKEHAK